MAKEGLEPGLEPMLSLLPILSLVQHPSCLLSKKGELWAPSVLSSGLGVPRLLVGLLALGCQGPRTPGKAGQRSLLWAGNHGEGR